MVSRAPLVILGLAAACVPPAPARPADVTPLRTWAGCYVLSAAPFPSNIGSGYQLPDSIALETSGAGTRYDKVRQYQLGLRIRPQFDGGGVPTSIGHSSKKTPSRPSFGQTDSSTSPYVLVATMERFAAMRSG